MMPPAPIEDLGRTDFREGRLCRLPSRCAPRAGVLLRLSPRAKVLDLKECVRCRGCGARGRNAVSIKVAAADRVTRCHCAILDQLAAVIGSTLPADATVVSRSATRASASATTPGTRA